MNEKQKTERWDLVDNAILELLIKLNPSNQKLKWDIKTVSEIRAVLVNYFVKELKLCSEYQFYP